MRTISAAVFCLLAGILITMPANAQCPATPTSWVFQTADGYGNAAIGVFTAQPTSATGLAGTMYMTITYNFGGKVAQELSGNGWYTVEAPACNTGLLYFFQTPELNSQYRYVINPSGRKMFLLAANAMVQYFSPGFVPNSADGFVGTTNSVMTGEAVRLDDPLMCGTSLNGTWTFLTRDNHQSATIGTITVPGPDSPPPPTGWATLSVSETAISDGSSLRIDLARQGTYQLATSCFGTMQFDSGTGVGRWGFIFLPETEKILMLAINGTGPGQTYAQSGIAVR